MTETGDARGAGRRARRPGRRAARPGRLARWARFLVTHQVPVGGSPAPPDRIRARPPTVGLVACHWVTGGFGDQVVTRVERALDRRGHVTGTLAVVAPRAPVVVVTHAGPRSRPVLPALGVEVAALAGRAVGLVAYGPAPAPDPGPLDALRAELSAAGARVADLVPLFDATRLHRPGATSRATVPADAEDPRAGPDPFGLLTLELVLDDLLAEAAAPLDHRPGGLPEYGAGRDRADRPASDP